MKDEYLDDDWGIPIWPELVYDNLQADLELRIPDYFWFNEPELNRELMELIEYLFRSDSIASMGRDNQFEYNWMRFSQQAEIFVATGWPRLQPWYHQIPKLENK